MESISGFMPLILMFLVVYFFMIRPQMKRGKQEKKFAAELKKGDKVVTKSGLHAKVLELTDEQTCILESGAGKMKFERASISMELSQKLQSK
ncbi:MAG: preprotein translocase subunit YajC [Bacteroidetes bacterium]|jgi:preprotein translocase subunit YajC|nr:preprotein translocase subunit YajC [Flavobacteriaceae bacterium]MDA0719666.1 preprotein translocase subunit YajC [Bacteroidota bacterium]MDA0863282.1 preprotein translocase subunit YajC [Bacteroidota bacterium]HCK04806.1 preprotein translocase subunit YajC [Flavobacteriaceae bacterium]